MLSSIDLSTAGKDGKPMSLGEVIKQVQALYKVRLDASTNQKSRQTTFFLKADSKKELDKAKRSLLALLSPVVRLFSRFPLVFPPVSYRPNPTLALGCDLWGRTCRCVRDNVTRYDIHQHAPVRRARLES